MELIEAVGPKENQRNPEVIQLSVTVVNDAAMFLGVSQNGLAALLGIGDTKTVRTWFLGKDTPRKSALLLLQRLISEVVLPPDTLNPKTGVKYCVDAICGILDEIETKAMLAGWEVSEVQESVKQWANEKKL